MLPDSLYSLINVIRIRALVELFPGMGNSGRQIERGKLGMKERFIDIFLYLLDCILLMCVCSVNANNFVQSDSINERLFVRMNIISSVCPP